MRMGKKRLSIYISDEEVIALLRELQRELSKELCGKEGVPCRFEKGEYLIPMKYLVGIIVKEYANKRNLGVQKGTDDLDDVMKRIREIQKEIEN